MLLSAFVIPYEQSYAEKICLVTHLIAHINHGKAFSVLAQKLWRDDF